MLQWLQRIKKGETVYQTRVKKISFITYGLSTNHIWASLIYVNTCMIIHPSSSKTSIRTIIVLLPSIKIVNNEFTFN